MKRAKLYAACGAVALLIPAGCGGLTGILRSGDPELVYDKALEYYDAGKWSRASTLFEGSGKKYKAPPRGATSAFA